MALTISSIALGWLTLSSMATPVARGPKFPFTAGRYTFNHLDIPQSQRALTPLQVTDNVVQLRRVDMPSMSSVVIQEMMANLGSGGSRATSGNVTLLGVQGSDTFLAPVTVGGQVFEAVIDSGSSDPWLVLSNFSCFDPNTGSAQAQSACLFGPTYNPALSPTFQSLPLFNFNISYADGENLAGRMGYDSVTIAGINVPSQEMGLVDYAAWQGDGYSSGVIGFAYSTLTNAYLGSNPSQDIKGLAIHYNPFFTNAINNGAVSPVWSIAVSRDPNNPGVLALGGIPNIPHSPTFVSTPIQPLGVNGTDGSLVYQYYTITINGFGYSTQPNAQFNPGTTPNPAKVSLASPGASVIVDTGTTLVYAPNSVAAGVAAAFNPPGQYDAGSGVYYVPCGSKPPTFVVGVGGKILYANPLDMILQVSQTQCISGVQGNNGGLTILGNVWLKSVIAVFDIGASQMRFAARLS